MMRAFEITLTTGFQNLLTLIDAITGATPTHGILPDRVCELIFTAPASGEATGVIIGDSNNANTSCPITLPFTIGPFAKNVIELGDYNLKAGSGGTMGVIIEVA